MSRADDAHVHHVALRVESIERSIAFYRALLGFEVLRAYPPDGRPEIVHLREPGSRIVLELIGPDARTLPDRVHLGIRCRDLAPLAERLADWDVTASLHRVSLGDENILFFRDPDGHLIEANDSLPAADVHLPD